MKEQYFKRKEPPVMAAGKPFGQTVEILITFHCVTALVPLLHNRQVLKVLRVGGEGRERWLREGPARKYCVLVKLLCWQVVCL